MGCLVWAWYSLWLCQDILGLLIRLEFFPGATVLLRMFKILLHKFALFKGLCLLFLSNFPEATFIQGATFIPDSRVWMGPNSICHYDFWMISCKICLSFVGPMNICRKERDSLCWPPFRFFPLVAKSFLLPLWLGGLSLK